MPATMTRHLILLVDDDPLITQMLGMVLELSLNVDVVATNSSLRAREILQQGQVSLLLTDYLMPEMNGLNLVRALRDDGSTIPVILLTGYCDEPELAANTERLKPFEVLVKPWSNELLMQRIKANLDAPRV
jgi:two-component system response regulator MtrA